MANKIHDQEMSKKRRCPRRGPTCSLIASILAVLSGPAAALQPTAEPRLVASEVNALNTNAGFDHGEDFEPTLASDGRGNWIAIWESEDRSSGKLTSNSVLIARSADDGQSWTDPFPVAINPRGNTEGVYAMSPQIATDRKGQWIAVWSSDASLDGTVSTDTDIHYSRSDDNGATWTDPQPLNNNAFENFGLDQHPHLFTDRAGRWLAVWETGQSIYGYYDADWPLGGDWDIMVSYSDDRGVSWSDPKPLNNDAFGVGRDDLQPQLATDRKGLWIAVWSSREELDRQLGDDYDILISRSEDGGKSWSDPAPLNSYAAMDDGQDTTPRVATDGQGQWVVIWHAQDDHGVAGTGLKAARSNDDGITWTAAAPLNPSSGVFAAGDFDPALAADGRGNWMAVWSAAMFEEPEKPFPSFVSGIVAAYSADGGTTWEPTLISYTSGGEDAMPGTKPQIATDGLGQWVAVFQSSADIDGRTGPDRDVFATRFITDREDTDTDSNGPPDGDDDDVTVRCEECGTVCGAGVGTVTVPVLLACWLSLAGGRRYGRPENDHGWL